ncbi:hypothetical protein K469DRAFT_761458 [Zopfia rhizophila CBS 207.26]|uniref:MACPF domain-containing protein n=1 Tax=Zopfia rhizophila CBS 207.26 TaxID=1314779 RepID=A0A6A6DCH8_9PEZI|nr:hypothetical protein K469DRAFT_761458 [Zopfia rhizophila CBS 207.26]
MPSGGGKGDANADIFAKPFHVSLAIQDKTITPSVALDNEEVVQLGNVKVTNDLGLIKLSCFWQRIAKNTFCLPNGAVLSSQKTLRQYYSVAQKQYSADIMALTKDDPPTLTICYKEEKRVANPQKASDVKMDTNFHELGKVDHDPGFTALPQPKDIDPKFIATGGSGSAIRPAQMTTAQWNEVLVSNSLLSGFAFDESSTSLERARRAAFKLQPNPIHPYKFSPGTVTSKDLDELKKDLDQAALKATPMAQLRAGLKTALTGADAKEPRKEASVSTDGGKDSSKVTEPLDLLYPLWEMCDGSDVKIETTTTTRQHSAAAQGFSSMSVEAAISASVMSFSGSVSAGYAQQSSSSTFDETGSSEQQMHASYEFPRVRLYLDNNSLSVSDDCAAALRNIKQTESYRDLVDFYREYGTVFVTQVKLGGRLRASRRVTAAQAKDMSTTASSWKASVSASFSGTSFSASAKFSTEQDHKSSDNSQSSNLDDAVAWVAQGGDTTLVNNPGAWCSSVGNYWFWRAVDQEIVLPIEQVIATFDEYAWTRSCFAKILAASVHSSPREIRWDPNWTLQGPRFGVALTATPAGNLATISLLTKSPFLDIKPSDIITTPMQMESNHRWTAITDDGKLRQLLTSAFDEFINSYIGTNLYPKYVLRLLVSDRAFTVILNFADGFEKASVKPSAFKWQKPLPITGVFATDYGHYCIDSITSGQEATVIWVFAPEGPYTAQGAIKKQVESFFSDPDIDLEAGYLFLSSLATSIPCETYFYDAHFNETRLSSPADAQSMIEALAPIKAHVQPPKDGNVTPQQPEKQPLKIHLRPFIDLATNEGGPGGIPSPISFSISNVRKLRRINVEYVVGLIKSQDKISPIRPQIDARSRQIFPGLLNFDYPKVAEPDGWSGNLQALASEVFRLPNTDLSLPLEKLLFCTRGQEAIERMLRWLRLSRRAEYLTRLETSLDPAMFLGAVIGCRQEPSAKHVHKTVSRRRMLRTFLENLREVQPHDLAGQFKDVSDVKGIVQILSYQLGDNAMTTEDITVSEAPQHNPDLLIGNDFLEYIAGPHPFHLQSIETVTCPVFKDEELFGTEEIDWEDILDAKILPEGKPADVGKA